MVERKAAFSDDSHKRPSGQVEESGTDGYKRSSGAARPIRCLIVEDDENDAVLLKRLLRKMDAFVPNIDCVMTLAEALKALRSHRYDVALVDYRLPDAKGTEIVRAMGARDAEIPVILLSAEDSEQEVEFDALDAGAYDFVCKQDLTPRFLQRILRFAFDRYECEVRLREERRKMRIARDQAERANAAKDRFLAMLNHELRTPLNAIIGFAEILAEEQFGKLGNAKYKEYADDIRMSGAHLLGVINELLDFAGATQQNLNPSRVAVCAQDVLDDALKLLESQRQKQSIKIDSAIPEDFPCLWLDPRMFLQMLLNLIGNALKFTPEGGRVRIEANWESDAVRIVIEDTGCGIPAKYLSRIKDPFFQAHGRPYTVPEGGWGLGLAVVDRLVRAHDGQLVAESVDGEGTTITLEFPFTCIVSSSGNDSHFRSNHSSGSR